MIAAQYRRGSKGLVHKKFAIVGASLVASIVGFAGSAHASEFKALGGDGTFSLQMSYALAVRVKNPADGIVNTAPDPLVAQGVTILEPYKYPKSANYDDGDRNFKSGSLVNNRISALGELNFTKDNYGAQVRGDAFFDAAYLGSNNNDSPGTINKTGPNNEFTSDAHRFDGRRIRLLDAYGFGSWNLGEDMDLNVRLGRQVVAWGESLFFPNISGAQAPADATKANIPGADVKSILLPVNQVSLQLSLTNSLTLLGQYKMEFKATELDPVGEFFSIADVVGPGAQFVYGLHNPLAFLPGAPPDISDVRYAGELNPSSFGQYGLGLKYAVTRSTTLGLYRLRYHDTKPSPYQNFNCNASITANIQFCDVQNAVNALPALGRIIQNSNFDIVDTLNVPTTYNIRYFAGVDLSALSFSTTLFGLSWAGDVSYRQKTPILVNYVSSFLGHVPVPMPGDVTQINLNGIYATGSGLLWDSINIAGELGYVFVNHTDPYIHTQDVPTSPDQTLYTGLTYSRTSWAGSVLVQIGENGVFNGWDLLIPITFSGVAEGQTSQLSSFGSLMGAGDIRASLGLTFTHLQSLDLGIVYSAFFGNPDFTTHPYADRDNLGLNATYRF